MDPYISSAFDSGYFREIVDAVYREMGRALEMSQKEANRVMYQSGLYSRKDAQNPSGSSK